MNRLLLFCLLAVLSGAMVACGENRVVNEGPAGPIYDHYLYLNLANHLQIINIDDNTDPQVAGFLAAEHALLNQPQILGDQLVVAHHDLNTYAQTYQIYDLSNPTQPALTGSLPGLGTESLAIYNEFAFQVDRENGTLIAWDFSDPLQPQELDKVATTADGYTRVTEAFALTAVFGWCGRAAYCLRSVDFFTHDPAGQLEFVHTVPVDSRFNTKDFLLRDTELFYYLIEQIPEGQTRYAIRVLDLAAPTHDNHISTNEINGRPFFLSDGLLLIQEFSQAYQFNMRLFDLADSQNFVELAEFTLPGFPLQAVLENDILYLAFERYSQDSISQGNALRVIDLTDPAAPTILAELDLE